MTLDEFRSWFLGFAAGTGSGLSSNQWQRVKDRLAQLNGVETSESDFIALYKDVPGIIPMAISNLAPGGSGLTYDPLSAMSLLGRFEART